MDDIPDLPEFRPDHLESPRSAPAVAVNNGGPLKRTTSTPFSPSPSSYGSVSDSLMSRIGSPPPQTKIPSPPISGSHHRGSISSGSTARARARRILSSPSLGQRRPFRLDEDEDGPPRPLPPLPPLPLNIPDRLPRKGRPPGLSTGTGTGTTRTSSVVSSPPSEADSGFILEDAKDSEREEIMSMAMVEDTEMEIEIESDIHAKVEDEDRLRGFGEVMMPSKGFSGRFGEDRNGLEDGEDREGWSMDEQRRSRRDSMMEEMYDRYDGDEARLGAEEEEVVTSAAGHPNEHHGRPSYRLSSPDERRYPQDRYS
ncbi:hypothetical protein BGW38_008590 [Lunasporangiospora selenospora]|uniref:Uncharacterized protein n=1 Tax=Lunasporangiospora selenospora TaxID=979761 RepID=A0A9P6K9K1_9FUNG|nr:hypothetical protein BGW38_008590 [Lunasporangiospora selenospora]